MSYLAGGTIVAGICLTGFRQVRTVLATVTWGVKMSSKVWLFISDSKAAVFYDSETGRTTRTTMKEIQTLINRCLHIHGPGKVSNTEPWEMAMQTPVWMKSWGKRWAGLITAHLSIDPSTIHTHISHLHANQLNISSSSIWASQIELFQDRNWIFPVTLSATTRPILEFYLTLGWCGESPWQYPYFSPQKHY